MMVAVAIAHRRGFIINAECPPLGWGPEHPQSLLLKKVQLLFSRRCAARSRPLKRLQQFHAVLEPRSGTFLAKNIISRQATRLSALEIHDERIVTGSQETCVLSGPFVTRAVLRNPHGQLHGRRQARSIAFKILHYPADRRGITPVQHRPVRGACLKPVRL